MMNNMCNSCVYRIADFYFRCYYLSEPLQEFCKEFICNNPPRIDEEITLSDDDIKFEYKLADADERLKFSRVVFESTALYRKICAYVLKNNAFLMHGVAIECDGKGYLFAAPSGTGKTTHVRIWQRVFGKENVVIVNGDKPIIRFIDGKVYAYGTPWNGKERYGNTGCVELSGVCFLKRGEENCLTKLTTEEVLPNLFTQIMIADSSNLFLQLELVEKFVGCVNMYQMQCNMDDEAAKVCYEGMQVK